MIVQHVPKEDIDKVIGYGLCLAKSCGDGLPFAGYIGCSEPEDAVWLFLADHEGFLKADILEIVPIFDFRCGATLRSGGVCQVTPGLGTNHVGQGHCYLHEGVNI